MKYQYDFSDVIGFGLFVLELLKFVFTYVNLAEISNATPKL